MVKKRNFGLLVVLCLAMSIMMVFSVNAGAASNGDCGEHVTWMLDDDGVLTISGSGEMKNYEGINFNDGTEDWPEWRDLEVKEIIVENGVTSIGAHAFHGLEEAKSITLPETLTVIKNHAFTFSGIEKLVIPDNVKEIGFYAISDSVAVLEIGKGLEILDDAIQYNFDSNLKEIRVNEDNQYFASMDNVLFNKDKTELIRYAAKREGEVYTVPNSVKTIRKGAFERCTGLKNVIIPEGVEKIEDSVFFASWQMENIQIPNSLVEIVVDNFEKFGYGANCKMSYMGTKQDFEKINVVEGRMIGEKEDGNYIYEYVKSTLPEDCIEIVYNSAIKVLLNGQKINFDVYPQIINGRTMVPMRAIFEALGATVEWNNDTRSVTSVKDGVTIKLAIDSTELYVNESVKTLDVPACIISERTMVPVRAISEAFGCKVEWNNDTRCVEIVY